VNEKDFFQNCSGCVAYVGSQDWDRTVDYGHGIVGFGEGRG
jgi:hypothetical protein